MNRIVIDGRYCKGCRLCIDQCPKHVMGLSSSRNAKGYLISTAIKVEDCTGCLLCETICPDMAVTVEVSKDEV